MGAHLAQRLLVTCDQGEELRPRMPAEHQQSTAGSRAVRPQACC